MNCGCGGNTSHSEHILKTAKGAAEWGLDNFDPSWKGVRIEQDKCPGCKRMRVQAYRLDTDELIMKRG